MRFSEVILGVGGLQGSHIRGLGARVQLSLTPETMSYY